MKEPFFQLSDPLKQIPGVYTSFDTSVCNLDCGRMCAPHNPSGKPFCCDICHAVPAAYLGEWNFLQKNTNLWHAWRGNECPGETGQDSMRADTPENMLLLACLGPDLCQRNFRALSCRQFPFFPYVTGDYRFIGLAYDWEFENRCWVISNLEQVTGAYRQQFIDTHDRLFAFSQQIFDSYHALSEEMRSRFASTGKRIPLLHRNEKYYLVSPGSERLTGIQPRKLPKFGPYKAEKP